MVRVLSVGVLALCACGDSGSSAPVDAPKIIDAPDPIDAPPDVFIPDAFMADLTCAGNAAPTTADATITIAGTAQEVSVAAMGIVPAADVSIDICTGNCNGPNLLDEQGPTTSSGMFTTDALSTGGTPLDGYLIATKPGMTHPPTYVFPASPMTKSVPELPVIMLSRSLLDLLGMLPGGNAQDPTKGLVILAVTDCDDVPLEGASVTVKQNNVEVGDEPIDIGALAAQARGIFLITNVPPSAMTEVAAQYNATTFRAHIVNVVADSAAMTQVKPGY